jgi:hypothetical protein
MNLVDEGIQAVEINQGFLHRVTLPTEDNPG